VLAPEPFNTKDVTKMVPDASLLTAQHIYMDRSGFAQTKFKKIRWISSRMSSQE